MKKTSALLVFLAVRCIAAEQIEVVTMDQVANEQVAAQKPIAEEIASILSKARRIELVSLQPAELLDDKTQPIAVSKRYGFALLGTAISKKKEDAQTLATAIRTGILESDGEVAMCFDPRHAVRFQDGADYVDIVICFQCAHGYIQRNANKQWFTITKKPEAVFDALFSAHGLKKAP